MQQVLGLGLGNKLGNYSLFHKALYQSKSGLLELLTEHDIRDCNVLGTASIE